MSFSQSTRIAHPDLRSTPADAGLDARPFTPVWNGILHEFRNHLTVLMAATSELRAEIPPALALRVGDAICETERNVQGLTSLLAVLDASVRTVEPLISDLGGVVDRAIRLAAPAVGRRVSITADVPRKAGVRNRGSALECLLAALFVDLSRAEVQHLQLGGKDHEISRAPCISVEAEVGRRGLAILVESDGARPPPDSWRFLLAAQLAEKLDATLALADPADSTEIAAYVIQFR